MIISRNMVILASIIAAGLTAVPQGAAALPPTGFLSTTDIQQMIERKQYRPALQAITRAVDAVNPPTAIDRPAYLLLRVDCLLRMKSFTPARQAAQDVAREPTANARQRAQGLTLMLLIQRSPAGRFTPRPAAPPAKNKTAVSEAAPTAQTSKRANAQDAGPIDIGPPISRQKALRALFTDEQQTLNPRLQHALHDGDLTDALQALQPARDLAVLELGALGARQTPDLLSQVIDRALSLAAAQANSWESQIAAIEGPAMEWKTRTIVDTGTHAGAKASSHLVYYQTGPTDAQKKTLKALGDACRGFAPTLRQLAAFGADAEKLKALDEKVDPLITRCDTMLMTNFNATYLQKPPPHTYRNHDVTNPFPKSGPP